MQNYQAAKNFEFFTDLCPLHSFDVLQERLGSCTHTCFTYPSVTNTVTTEFRCTKIRKQGYMWLPEKGLCPPKIYFKEDKEMFMCV